MESRLIEAIFRLCRKQGKGKVSPNVHAGWMRYRACVQRMQLKKLVGDRSQGTAPCFKMYSEKQPLSD